MSWMTDMFGSDDILLDQEEFQKAVTDFEALGQKISNLQSKISADLDALQAGFDTPAGHKFLDSCRTNLLTPMEQQKATIQHVSETMQKVISQYESVFTEYQELNQKISSYES